MKEYQFTIQFTFNGIGKNKDECLDQGITDLDMYSVEHLFNKGNLKIVDSKRVDNG
tara:strand:- start:1068 stop:1235 length:168 start_codon:yes stop_codon:yes gene_type:complete